MEDSRQIPAPIGERVLSRLPETRRAMEQITRDPQSDSNTRAEAERLLRAIDETEVNRQ